MPCSGPLRLQCFLVAVIEYDRLVIFRVLISCVLISVCTRPVSCEVLLFHISFALYNVPFCNDHLFRYSWQVPLSSVPAEGSW